MKRSFLFIISLLISFPAFSQEKYEEPYALMQPGENFVIQLSPLSKDVSVSKESGTARALSDTSMEAMTIVPSWVRIALYDVLTRVGPSMEKKLGQLILDTRDEDPRYIDEVAFSIAHLPIEDILYSESSSFDPQLLLENVRNLYAADSVLHYVTIKEFNEGEDNYYTTVELDINGTQWTVPRDYYYWYIVHPKLSDDPALYVDPHTGNPSASYEKGRFWRSYIMADSPDPDYSKASTLKYPTPISDLPWSAKSGIEFQGKDSINEVKGPLGEPMLIHYAFGKGTVYAASMDLESSANPLINNLIAAGFGPGSLLTPSDHPLFLVIKDRDSFNGTIIEDQLDAEGFDYDVWDATDLSLATSYEDFQNYKKIIIPGDQSSSFYTLIQDKASYFEEWMSGYDDKVLLFLGAMDSGHENDDWNLLIMPFGIQRVSEGAEFTGTPGGYPKWNEVIALDATALGNTVWDEVVYSNMSGERFWSPDDTLLNRIGYLVSQTLELRVGELPPEYAGPDGDCHQCVIRSPYPVRIIYQHYGNCGELQDTTLAFGRTSLIPSAGVGGITEDHVWNEFFLNDKWETFQVSWSDGGTFIAVPGNAQDKDYGGGKDLAIVYRTRPDGKWENVTDRYSNTFTLNFIVKDSNGKPVEGAEVLLASETWYDPESLTYAIISHTGHDGKVALKVGDFQNFYVRVSSPAGDWPNDGTVQWIVCEDENATAPGGAACPAKAPWNSDLDMILGTIPDVSYDIAINLEGALDATPLVTVKNFDETSIETSKAKVVYSIDATAIKAIHVTSGGNSFSDLWENDSPVPFYLFDKSNLDLYLDGQDATAFAELTADGTEHEIPVPGNLPYYISGGNFGSWGENRYVSLKVRMEDYNPGNNNEDHDISPGGSGCSCKNAGKRSDHSWIILSFILLGFFFYSRNKLSLH